MVLVDTRIMVSILRISRIRCVKIWRVWHITPQAENSIQERYCIMHIRGYLRRRMEFAGERLPLVLGQFDQMVS